MWIAFWKIVNGFRKNMKLEIEGQMMNVISAYFPQVGWEMEVNENVRASGFCQTVFIFTIWICFIQLRILL